MTTLNSTTLIPVDMDYSAYTLFKDLTERDVPKNPLVFRMKLTQHVFLYQSKLFL